MFRDELLFSPEFVLLLVFGSVLLTVFCFMTGVGMCWYSRHLTSKIFNRQIREIREGMGVSISGVSGDVSAGDVAGRDIAKGKD